MFDRLVKKILGIFPESIQKLYYKYESAVLYIFFGGLTTVVSIAAQYISTWAGAGTTLSTTISWICAVTFAFFTNKTCVFNSVTEKKRDFFREAAQFYGARLVSYFLELGFMLGVAWQHKGYAFEMCQAVLTYAKEQLEMDAVQALVMEGNVPSERLCARLGFEERGKVVMEGKEYNVYHRVL